MPFYIGRCSVKRNQKSGARNRFEQTKYEAASRVLRGLVSLVSKTQSKPDLANYNFRLGHSALLHCVMRAKLNERKMFYEYQMLIVRVE